MELEDGSNDAASPSGNSDGNGRQTGDRNLAARRHTVGPSDTPHDPHLTFGLPGGAGSPFYPMAGLAGLGYSPLHLASQVTFNPLLGLNSSDQARMGMLPSFDVCSPTSAVHSLNSQVGSGVPDSPGLFNGITMRHSITIN